MRPIVRGFAALGIALVLAACSGGGGNVTTAPHSTTAGAAPCKDSTGTTTVQANVKDRTWTPSTVTAKVGDVITWTNADTVPHAVALDDGSCAMSNTIAGGASKSLSFSVAGSFPFHCSVHPTMKGTITIS
jgi:plastocyanin